MIQTSYNSTLSKLGNLPEARDNDRSARIEHVVATDQADHVTRRTQRVVVPSKKEWGGSQYIALSLIHI